MRSHFLSLVIITVYAVTTGVTDDPDETTLTPTTQANERPPGPLLSGNSDELVVGDPLQSGSLGTAPLTGNLTSDNSGTTPSENSGAAPSVNSEAAPLAETSTSGNTEAPPLAPLSGVSSTGAKALGSDAKNNGKTDKEPKKEKDEGEEEEGEGNQMKKYEEGFKQFMGALGG